MIDTHAHVYFESFDSDRDGVMQRCNTRLDAVINIGVDMKSSKQAIELAQQEEKFYAVVGFNPGAVVEQYEQFTSFDPMIEELEELVSYSEKVVGIGEIGLDYHWPEHASEKQKEYQVLGFRKQIKFALEHNLPIVIHSRDAFEDTVEVLSDYCKETTFKGVWHSFTYGKKQMDQATELGLHIGVNGIVTYKSAQDLQLAVKEMDLKRLLLETDSPYLAPQEVRGQRNEPIYVAMVAERVVGLTGIDIERLVRQTDINAKELFSIGTIE